MVQRSKAGLISRAGMYLGFALVALAVWLIWSTMSPRYWPLLIAGLVIGCASTPSYYYFKTKEKDVKPYEGVEVQTLGSLGHQISEEHHEKDN